MNAEIITETFEKWTRGLDALAARATVFEKIRDIPYAVLPELMDSSRYADALTLNAGSCTSKHLLLADMYGRLGLTALLAVYPFRWSEETIPYPQALRRLAEDMPIAFHMACKVEIGGRLVLVDATLDRPLKALGLPVNETWDGFSDTASPLAPCGEEELFDSSEAVLMPPRQLTAEAASFYRKLNAWLETARQSRK